MTDAGELLDRLAELGASVTPHGDRLVIRAGPSGIPAALMVRLRAAKSEMMAVLASDADAPSRAVDSTTHPIDAADAAWWRDHFVIRTIHWELGGRRTRLESQQIAFNNLVDDWRKRYGRNWPAWQCAGCDEPIGGLRALTLADENRVHSSEGTECLIRFGLRWRGDAVVGLRAFGLEPPPGFKLL